MRLAFYALLLANLGLFAASQWFGPQRPAAAPSAATGGAGAPRRILLSNERPPPPAAASAGAGAATDPAMVDDSIVAASAEGDTVATGDAAAAGDAVAAGAADATSLGNAAAAGVVPAMASASAGAGAGATSAQRCVSLGPFRELDIAAAATAMLKKDGYEPRQRPANGPVPDDYLVVVGNLRNEADQQRVVRRLNRGGLDDAFPLPKLDDGWAVSVGVFSQAQRADRRRLAVARMGLDAKVLERTRPGTVYWLDIDLKPAVPGAPDPAAAWLKPADPAQALQVVSCPQPGGVR